MALHDWQLVAYYKLDLVSGYNVTMLHIYVEFLTKNAFCNFAAYSLYFFFETARKALLCVLFWRYRSWFDSVYWNPAVCLHIQFLDDSKNVLIILSARCFYPIKSLEQTRTLYDSHWEVSSCTFHELSVLFVPVWLFCFFIYWRT